MSFRDYALWCQAQERAKNNPIDPLIWGASVPGNTPIPHCDTYIPLTDTEARAFHDSLAYANDIVRAAHEAGWRHRRMPNG